MERILRVIGGSLLGGLAGYGLASLVIDSIQEARYKR